MRKAYVIACEEAGLEKEHIRAIQREVDRYKNRRRKRKFTEIRFLSELEYSVDRDINGKYERDVEETVFHNLDLERLRNCLNDLPDQDRTLLLDLYDSEYGMRKRLCDKYGISPRSLSRREKKLTETVRKRFNEWDSSLTKE